MEKTLKSNLIYDGKIIKVYVDDVSIDDENRSKREVVSHRGGACIALQDEDGQYFMVRQYRYAIRREMLEFCAGKLEEGESPKEAIIRECSEELGYTLKDLKEHSYIIPTCGYCNEKIYLFSAKMDRFVGKHLDRDERINVEKHSLDEILTMIKKGEIHDAKTIALALALKEQD